MTGNFQMLFSIFLIALVSADNDPTTTVVPTTTAPVTAPATGTAGPAGPTGSTQSQGPSTTQNVPTPVPNFFQILIRDLDNPSGTLIDGSACSNFGFVGVGCDYSIQASVSVNDGSADLPDQVTDLKNNGANKISNLNLLISAADVDAIQSFDAFTLNIKLTSQGSLVDQYSISINTTDPFGIATYTSTRPGTLPTIISYAWSTNIQPVTPAPTTEAPMTSSTGTGTSGAATSPAPTTPGLPRDCDQVTDKTNGAKTIYPDGSTAVEVVCEFTDNGAYTTIQSRGTTAQADFNTTYDGYIQSFGKAAKDSDFWLGLENMHQLTSGRSYSLQIDVCCGASLISRQFYHNFSISDSSTKYTLNAIPDIQGIGLAYIGSTKVSDLGAQFATPDSYNSSNWENCDELGYIDDSDKEVKPFGGWWYGGCGNNLNGYPQVDPGQCNITSTFDATPYLGINLRTTGGQGYGGFDVDLVSYTRVRMAVFNFDTILVEKTNSDFCQ